MNDLLNDIGDFPGWIALFLELIRGGKSPSEAAKGVVAQRLPNMFGIGRTDEQLFESIRQLVTSAKRRLIDLVVGEMRDYEESIFRITVAGMPCGSELVDDLVKNPQKGQPATTKKTVSWELTTKDLRVKYLEDIADEVAHLAATSDEKLAAKQVVKAMRSRRLITRSPAARRAYKLWVSTTAWVEMEILDFFDVDSFKEITLDMVAGLLEKVALRIPERTDADLNHGFWQSTFRRHPALARILVVGTAIMATWFFCIA